MRRTRSTSITVETERLVVVGHRGRYNRVVCAECPGEVEMVVLEEAGAAAGLNRRAIFRAIEAGRVHFAETSRGTILVCLRSLLTLTRAQDEINTPTTKENQP